MKDPKLEAKQVRVACVLKTFTHRTVHCLIKMKAANINWAPAMSQVEP